MQVSVADVVNGARQETFQIGGDDVHSQQQFVDYFRRFGSCNMAVMRCQLLRRAERIAAD